MIKLQKILWPTDFSDSGNSALLYATELANQFGAELHIVHVIVEPAYATSSMGVGYVDVNYFEDMRKRSDAELARFGELESCRGLKLVYQTLEGAVAEQISQYAQDNDISMIIIGTHGYSGLSRLLLGSVAEKVLRIAKCPVLSVHADDHQFISAAAD